MLDLFLEPETSINLVLLEPVQQRRWKLQIQAHKVNLRVCSVFVCSLHLLHKLALSLALALNIFQVGN